ncbi:MAG: DUF6491 family protein [Gammaproteobacteria bacterium]|nr:hypothetical protein [Pseudomonadales bacterium]MCP5348623.1 hypothetical protein [Pseudomonadales bacterium]
MPKQPILSISLILALIPFLTACAGSQDRREQAIALGEPGRSVQSICFVRQIESWQPLSEEAIVIERAINDYYRLNLIGACEPDLAFNTLQFESRSGICLNPGDEIEFPGSFSPSCTISSIDTWIPLVSTQQ